MICDIERADSQRRTAQAMGKIGLKLGRGKLARGVKTRQNLCRLCSEHGQQFAFEGVISGGLTRKQYQIEGRLRLCSPWEHGGVHEIIPKYQARYQWHTLL